ncbi:MAG: DedA family protein [Acidobacteriota bacterium]
MSTLNELLAFALSLPPSAVLILVFLSAWLEFVFPPYLGDSMMLFGFFLAGQGVVGAHEVFVAAVVGSILGSAVAFVLGGRFGAQAIDYLARFRRTGKAPEKLRHLLSEHGEKVLLINRFLPFFRNFMLYGAGAFRLRFLPSMAANAVSVVAFVSFLMALGLMAAGSFEQLQATFQRLFGLGGAVAILGTGLWVAWVSRKQTPLPEPSSVVD